MTAEIRNLLSHWSDLWRYPALLSAFERRSQELTPEEAAAGLLAGIAADHDPRGAVVELIDRGEFIEADRALGLLKVAAERPSDRELEALRRDVVAARGRVLDEVQARAASLARRARQVGRSTDPPADLEDLAAERRSAAIACLNDWEGRISGPEQEAAKALRARLVAVEPAAESDWARGVIRCIEAREFDAAEQLLRSGPGAISPDTPAAVPPRKAWPYSDQPRDIVGWFLGTTPAPPTFLRDWGTNDSVALAVLQSLQGLLAPGGTVGRMGAGERKHYLGVTEVSVREFAQALDAALGGPATANRTVRLAGDGYETHLAGLADMRAPWLPLGEGGVRLWVCRLAETASPPVGAFAAAPISFFLHSSYAAPRRMLAFDCAALFRSLADRQRLRVHLLRELGAKVDLACALPGSIPAELGLIEVRTYLDWFLDLLGLRITGPEVVDLLVYHSGGRIALLVPLLSAVFDLLPNRQVTVSVETVSAALRRETFLRPAANALLSPLTDDPGAKAALAAVILAAERPGVAVETDLVALACEELAECPAPPDLPDCLARLAEKGLLNQDRATNSFALPVVGIGPILTEALTGSVAVEVIRSTWAL
jgi:hypothetical protein